MQAIRIPNPRVPICLLEGTDYALYYHTDFMRATIEVGDKPIE